MPEHYAAEASGISASTFREWMEKGAKGIDPYGEFHTAVKQSIARAVPDRLIRPKTGPDRLSPVDAHRPAARDVARTNADPEADEDHAVPSCSPRPQALWTACA